MNDFGKPQDLSCVAEKGAYEARLKAAQAEISCLKHNHELEVACLRSKTKNWQTLAREKDRLFKESLKNFRVKQKTV